MNRIIKSVIFMFIVTLIFTTLVTAVKTANNERIERNRSIKLQRTIMTVLGLNNDALKNPEKVSEIFNRRIKQEISGDHTIYTCYEDDGKTITGYAFPVDGPGFWGPVYAITAVNPEATKLMGVSFYRHSETPGLGGRISEKWFSGQFKGLSLELSDDEKQYFYLTQESDKSRKNELDAITGASRTSDAVESFLNRELKIVVDELRKKKSE